MRCTFCGGQLGAIEKQEHDNPDFAEYRTCLNCGYQWAKKYWVWLDKKEKEQGYDLPYQKKLDDEDITGGVMD